MRSFARSTEPNASKNYQNGTSSVQSGTAPCAAITFCHLGSEMLRAYCPDVTLMYIDSVPTEADPILSVFYDTGAYLRGHFRLTSGLHSPEYLQCARVLQYPRHAEHFGRLLASEFRRLEPTLDVSVVVSPAIGGLIIGHEVARALGARFIFTERDASGKMVLRRGFTIETGETSVMVEDVITTGGSSREVIGILKESGARVLAAGSIIDRSGGAADLGVPRVALKTLEVTAYAADDCPLCRSGSPVIKPGSRPVHAAN